jgi:glucose/arabinose dehydrogenase
MKYKIISLLFCTSILLTGYGSAINSSSINFSNISLDTYELDIEVINGGFGINAIIRNTGETNATNIKWSIQLEGGIILVGKKSSGEISLLRPDKTTTIETPSIFGFGKTTITVTVEADTINMTTKISRGQIKLFFVTILPGEQNALTAQLDRVARGFKSPTVLTHSGDGSNRLFVADLTGQIYVIENGDLQPEPFLDISEEMVKVNPIYDERGLLGLVFHPEFENNGRFFVYYSAPKSGEGIDHESIIAEYQVSEEINIADPDSEQIIMRIDQPESNHNGGQLAFGPDGYLYIGLGDGGGAGDQHSEIGNGQDINTSLGSVLRIDVNNETPYGIPEDNPFVGIDGLDEIYAYGFRNPYRFSFDMQTNRLFLADVGQDEWEEIDIVEKGGNYGWRILEGTHPYDLSLADILGFDIETLNKTIHEYSHSVGKSIIGGYVYRGSLSINLEGKYVFADWSKNFMLPRGKLYYLEEIVPNTWQRFEFKLTNDKPLKRFILGLGEDENGELYLLTTRTPGSLLKSGEIWHISAGGDNK